MKRRQILNILFWVFLIIVIVMLAWKIIGSFIFSTDLPVVKDVKYCEVDDDCIIVAGGEHPCACWTAINKKYEEEFEIEINKIHEAYYDKYPVPDCQLCAQITEEFRNSAVCVNNKCELTRNGEVVGG